jgi:glyoxylase-like metal-dependent hydrolase (beta-lactamase superfamily II)
MKGGIRVSNITGIMQGLSNLFLVEDKHRIIVDTGSHASQECYQELFLNLGVNPRDIQLIIITHGHSDHFANVLDLKEITGAPVLCHKNAVAALKTGKNSMVKPRNELGQKILEMISGKEPVMRQVVEPDITVEDVCDLYPYGVAGRVIYTPGHSSCSVSVLLDSGEAIVGDMLVADFMGNPCAAYFATDEKALFANIKLLLGKAHTFYSGHGGPFSKAEIIKAIENEEEVMRYERRYRCS